MFIFMKKWKRKKVRRASGRTRNRAMKVGERERDNSLLRNENRDTYQDKSEERE